MTKKTTKKTAGAPASRPPRLDLRRIERGGLFGNVSSRLYREDPLPTPSVNQSTLFMLQDQSPAHAFLSHPRLNPAWSPSSSSTEEQDFGSAAHACLLGAGKVKIVDAPNWRTDFAKTARQQARANHETPILKKTWSTVVEMTDTLRKDLSSIDSPLPNVFDPKYGGEPEVLAAWQEDGLWCRALADWWISPTKKTLFAKSGMIVDYKTTFGSAKAEAWTAALYRSGNPFQPVWYPHGFAMALAQSRQEVPLPGALPRFVYIVQEAYPPFAHEIIEASEIALEHTRTNVIEAFSRWHACITTGEWPKYPRRIHRYDPPAWLVKADEFRRVAGDVFNKPI